MKVAICVCTYKRPEGLINLLSSFSELAFNHSDFEVFIADNDPIEHAGFSYIKDHSDKYPFRINCQIETGIGISHARNKTIQMVRDSETSYDYIAFTDDDVVVSPTWLRDLIHTAKFYNAHAVSGKLEPLFEKKPIDLVFYSSFYHNSFPATGAEREDFATNNVLIKTEALNKLGSAPFDLKLSTFGGEDMDLSFRIRTLNYKIICCATACVYEHFQDERLTENWIQKRYFRSGASYAYIVKKHCGIIKFSMIAIKKCLLLPFRLMKLLMTTSPEGHRKYYTDQGYLHFVINGLAHPEYNRPSA